MVNVLDLLKNGLRDGHGNEPAGRLWLAAGGMALFALLWAVVERLATRGGLSAPQLVWMRYGTHLLLLSALFGPSAGTGLVRTPALTLHVVRSLMMLGMPLSFIAALKYLSMREVETVFWLGIAAFCGLRIVQARGVDLILCILSPVLALAGAWQLLGPFHIPLRPALVLPLATAAFFLSYQILTRAMASESELSKLFHTALWVFFSLCFYVPLHWHTPAPIGWAVGLTVGVLGCGALFALDLALRNASPFRLAAVSFLQPLFAVGGAVLLGRERFSGALLSGGACILLGGLVGLIPGRRLRMGSSS